MKRTFITLLLAAVICVTEAYCQTEVYKRVTWGVKASVDVELPGKWKGDDISLTMYRPGYGFTAGGVCNINLGGNVYLEPGLSLFYEDYSFKDLIISNESGDYVQKDPGLYKLGLRVPLVVGSVFPINERAGFSIFTGPVLSYAFAGKIDVDSDVDSDLDDLDLFRGQRRFDCAWKIGVGCPVDNFMVSLEAEFGITDLLKAKDLSFRENRVLLGLTYYF